MKKSFLAAILMAVSIPASAQVGVSVSIGEPGFYGQVNIGDAPPPQLIYAQPVVIAPAPQFVGVPPIYLRVPFGYAQHWRRYCGRYHACGRPVYFVSDGWYRNTYVPYYRAHGPHRPEYRDDRHERWHGHDWDRGHDRGRGHDHGHGDRDH